MSANPLFHCGIDVSKAHLDLHLLPDNTAWRVSNTPEEHQALAEKLLAMGRSVKVVVEATGGLERPVCAALAAAGVVVIIVNPVQAHHFARSLSANPAKTDKADARVLAVMAERVELEPRPLPDAQRRELSEVVARRRQLVEMVGRERMRLDQAVAPRVRGDIQATIAWLEARIKDIDNELDALVQAIQELYEVAKVLEQFKGVGPVTARALVACLPELGQLDRRAICSLAGLAPIARDSGAHKGARHIQGGRGHVRQALWMAALTARRCNPSIKAFYDRLKQAGKPYKVAMTACMRKVLCMLNSMVRQHLKPVQPSPCT